MTASHAGFIYDHLNLLQKDLAELDIPLIYQECHDITDATSGQYSNNIFIMDNG